MFSLVVPPVVVLFIFGVFSRRGGSCSALATLAFGHLASLTLFLLQKFELFPSLHFTLTAALIAILSAAIYILTWSFGRQKNEKELSDLLTHKPLQAEPGWKNYKLQSLILLLLTGALVTAFWL